MIWSLIVGAIIGLIAGVITKGGSMGWIANILAFGRFCCGSSPSRKLGPFIGRYGFDPLNHWCRYCGSRCILCFIKNEPLIFSLKHLERRPCVIWKEIYSHRI